MPESNVFGMENLICHLHGLALNLTTVPSLSMNRLSVGSGEVVNNATHSSECVLSCFIGSSAIHLLAYDILHSLVLSSGSNIALLWDVASFLARSQCHFKVTGNQKGHFNSENGTHHQDQRVRWIDSDDASAGCIAYWCLLFGEFCTMPYWKWHRQLSRHDDGLWLLPEVDDLQMERYNFIIQNLCCEFAQYTLHRVLQN